MNILVSLDSNYLKQLKVMITSLLCENPREEFAIYVLNSSITDSEFENLRDTFNFARCTIIDIKVDEKRFSNVPVTDRYPKEMYFRIFASKLLPDNIDKILYLDPDLVVINSIKGLYDMDLANYYFAGATHIGKQFNIINEVRLNMPPESEYINSGVLLMNLKLLRKEQNEREVFNYIKENSIKLFLPDQDIINALYSYKTISIEAEKYNLGEIYYKKIKYLSLNRNDRIDLRWVINNASIIHYYGRNKPWKLDYWGELDIFYYIYEKKLMDLEMKKNNNKYLK